MYNYRRAVRRRNKRMKNIARFILICLVFSLVASIVACQVQKEQDVALLQRAVKSKDLQIKELEKELHKTQLENAVIIKEVDDLNNKVQQMKVIKARVTAYAPLDNKSGICAEGDPTITATGTNVRRGVVAVDPKEIPYFTQLEIPGYGIASAEDTGGALRNYKEGVAIDVLMNTYEEAMEWGVQYLDVIIHE